MIKVFIDNIEIGHIAPEDEIKYLTSINFSGVQEGTLILNPEGKKWAKEKLMKLANIKPSFSASVEYPKKLKRKK